MAKEKAPRKPKKTQSRNLAFSLIYGVGCAGAAIVILLFILPVMLQKSTDPDKMIPIFALAIALVAGITGGVVSAKKHGESGAMTGLLSGIILTVLLFLISLFVKKAEVPSTVGYKGLLAAMIILPSILGGKSALNKRKVRRR